SAATGGVTRAVPVPTDATRLGGPHSGLSAGTVDVPVYNQTGPSAYQLVGSTPLTVTDTRPPSQVRFLNDLIICNPGCQSLTARLTASEGYTWLSVSISVRLRRYYLLLPSTSPILNAQSP